jgi:hypothetical protein
VLGWYAFPQPAATVLAALGVVIGVVFIGGVIVANRRKNPSLTVGLPLAIWPALLVVFMATAIMAIRSGYGPTRDVGAFVARQPDDYRVLVYRPKVAESLVYYMARERAVEFYYLTRVQGQPEPRLRAAGDGRRYDGYAPSWWPKTEEYTRAFWQTLDALRASGETAIVVTDATGEARIKAIAPDAVKVYEGGSAVVLKVRPTVPAPAAPAAPTPPTP